MHKAPVFLFALLFHGFAVANSFKCITQKVASNTQALPEFSVNSESDEDVINEILPNKLFVLCRGFDRQHSNPGQMGRLIGCAFITSRSVNSNALFQIGEHSLNEINHPALKSLCIAAEENQVLYLKLNFQDDYWGTVCFR